MSKFATIVILSLALFAYIEAKSVEFPEEDESQAFATTDESELAYIDGTQYSVFSDFCLKSRDAVYGDIRQKSDKLSSNVYAMFFNSAGDIGREALEISKIGAERMTAQLANPNAAIAEGTNDAENIIVEGQQNIQKVQTQPKALIEAFKSTVRAVGQAVNDQFAQRMESLRNLADVGTVISTLQTVCANIADYENENSRLFQEAKVELVKADPKLAFVEMSKVPCVTSRQVTRLDSLCKFVVASKDSVQKLASTFSRSS